MARRMDIRRGQIYAGDAVTWNWTIDDGEGGLQNITGYTLTFVVAETEGGAALLTKTPTVVSGAAGTCTSSWTSANTTTLGGGTFYGYLKRTDSGSETTLWEGEIPITDLIP